MTSCARCDWQPVRDPDSPGVREQAAVHARDAAHPLCSCCGRSLSEHDPARACESCLATAREHLSGIVTLWAELPRHLGVIGAQRYDAGPRGGDEHSLPGGTVMALLAPGSAGGAARRLTRTDVERGVDGREHRVDNLPEDTPSVAWTLASWEDDWRITRREPAAIVSGGTAAVVRAAAGYLEVHARWAANHGEPSDDAFSEFADDLRQLHGRLEQATHRRRSPVKAGADCFDCGGVLVRKVCEHTVRQWWVPGRVGPLPAEMIWHGMVEESHVTCSTCHARYDDARYMQALKAAAWDAAYLTVDGEDWATPEALATDLGRPAKTVRTWRDRGLVRALSRGGVSFVHVADVTERHEQGAVRSA